MQSRADFRQVQIFVLDEVWISWPALEVFGVPIVDSPLVHPERLGFGLGAG